MKYEVFILDNIVNSPSNPVMRPAFITPVLIFKKNQVSLPHLFNTP